MRETCVMHRPRLFLSILRLTNQRVVIFNSQCLFLMVPLGRNPSVNPGMPLSHPLSSKIRPHPGNCRYKPGRRINVAQRGKLCPSKWGQYYVALLGETGVAGPVFSDLSIKIFVQFSSKQGRVCVCVSERERERERER